MDGSVKLVALAHNGERFGGNIKSAKNGLHLSLLNNLCEVTLEVRATEITTLLLILGYVLHLAKGWPVSIVSLEI